MKLWAHISLAINLVHKSNHCLVMLKYETTLNQQVKQNSPKRSCLDPRSLCPCQGEGSSSSFSASYTWEVAGDGPSTTGYTQLKWVSGFMLQPGPSQMLQHLGNNKLHLGSKIKVKKATGKILQLFPPPYFTTTFTAYVAFMVTIVYLTL